MRKLIILIFLFTSACATKSRAPEVPKDALELGHALQQGQGPTLDYLKAHTTAKSYGELNSRDPMNSLPDSLRAEKISATNKDKSEQWHFLKKFRGWSSGKRLKTAQNLLEKFECGNVVESQSMGYSLELDFPEEKAMTLSHDLHEKVLTCPDYSHTESLFRLTVFAIQKGDCSKAGEYLNMFPAKADRGVTDRVAYLRSLCTSPDAQVEVADRNPWGGYGILLTEAKKASDKPNWLLTARSGSEEWDRLLVTFIELTEQNRAETVRYISSKLNYEKFRAQPLPFQTSMLVLMSLNGADLPVFQTLHRYLSEHPDMLSPAVAGLLFPVRYWKEIVDNSKSADPILVKALIRQESAFNPAARSRARAAGLMQLIYPTARHFGVKQAKQLLNPEANIHAGSEFLARLINDFGSVELALAAYNAGPAIVRDWQKRYPTSNINLFVEMIPYTETREYVRLVTRNYKMYQSILLKPQVVDNNNLAPQNLN